ncbi:Dam family site-specific DNA-(adenine-N6)-methyltransferase [Clostridium tyrobutyricum]|uniref:Dam family site-specific DNA-(adenine-N6)-methyltransferase n=1 Tax=Clostridium tyrobutyricum TaxID=1519 RepID=UPI00189D1559|nr:Dam family site-specific DNA-(adenine-N6)-methyltransferase [Clostridium tyrobutyricum]
MLKNNKQIKLNNIYNMDCIDGMKRLPENSIDIAIADPPYNLSKGGNWKWDNSVDLPGMGGNWNKVMQSWDNMDLVDYFKFTLLWLKELKRVVKPTGSIWIHGTYHNIGIMNFAMQILDIEIINEVIWYKRNSFPNLSGRRLTASHETILWGHTGGSKKREYYFNYDNSKELIFPEDNLKQPGKQMRTVWDIPNNKKKEELKYGKHPTQKPIRLIERMLKISAKKGDVLLSPFCGAGTDCVAAKTLGLNYIAFELEQEYIDISKKRLEAVKLDKILNDSMYSTLNSKKKDRSIDNIEQITLSSLIIGNDKSNKEDVLTVDSKVNSISNDDCNNRIKEETIPSILKWTGSKRKQANKIAAYFPKYDRYFEPFLGGGAMLYLVGTPGSYANDIYLPLIEFWKLVQNDKDIIIQYYNDEWNKLQRNFPDYYYNVRDRFNKQPNGLDLSFLTRTCVNGIVRFNKDGKFNNSFHLSRKGMKPSTFANIVNKWNKRIQGVNFTNLDYREMLEMTKTGDVVYLDPPYAGSNNRYIENLDVDLFMNELEKLNKKDVKWLLSFDGQRGEDNLEYPVPENLYKRKIFLPNGNSTLNQVLNGEVKKVEESLYMNF